MKTTGSIFTKITLGLLIAGGITACNNKGTSAPASTTSASSATDNKATTVYVQSDTLLSRYDYAKDMSQRLNDKGKAAQSDLAAKGQAFQREVAEYQKDQATLAADKRQSTEQHLQREQQELQQYQQNATAQFQSDQGAETGKLYDKITSFCKSYAKDKGYKLVLTYSKSNPTVLYVDPSLDVTNDVLKGLNEAYAKEKK